MPPPVFTAGTDGRVRAAKVKADGTADGAASAVAEVTKWEVRGETARQDRTSTASPTYAGSGAVAREHARGGGVLGHTFTVEGLVNVNPAAPLGYSAAAFRAGREYLWDFLLDKTTALGHHGVLGTIVSGGVTGVGVGGQPAFSVTVEANGLVPDLALPPVSPPPPP